jgi:hypothetical protein
VVSAKDPYGFILGRIVVLRKLNFPATDILTSPSISKSEDMEKHPLTLDPCLGLGLHLTHYSL